jgi:hypothetical protein
MNRLNQTIPNFEEIMMNKFQSALRVSLFVGISLAFATLAQAQATRTWVSGVGDDANPCSRTAPCKTFAGAISKTAAGGEISVLDPGGFGAITITKSITIDGTGMLGSILAAGTNGININMTGTADAAKSVRLRGLTINGAGSGINGITVMAANNVSIEDIVIDGFTKNGIRVETTSSAQVFVKNSSIRNNAGAGISVASGGSQVLMSNLSVVFNGTALVGNKESLISFKNNVVYGNKKDGDPSSPIELR